MDPRYLHVVSNCRSRQHTYQKCKEDIRAEELIIRNRRLGNNPGGRRMLNVASTAPSRESTNVATEYELPNDVWTRMSRRQREAYLRGKNTSRDQTRAPPKGKGGSAILKTVRFNSKNSTKTGKGLNVVPFHMKQGETKPKISPWRAYSGAQASTSIPKAILKAVRASPRRLRSKEIVYQTKKQDDYAPLELKNSKRSCCTTAYAFDGTVDKKPAPKKNKIQNEPPAFNRRMLLDGITHKIEDENSPKPESQKKDLPKTQIPGSKTGKTKVSKDYESNGWIIINDVFALCNHATGNRDLMCEIIDPGDWSMQQMGFGIASELFPKCIEKYLEENPGFHTAFKKEIDECNNIVQELLIEEPEEDLEQLKIQNKAKYFLKQEEKRINLKIQAHHKNTAPLPNTPAKAELLIDGGSDTFSIGGPAWHIDCTADKCVDVFGVHQRTPAHRCANWRRNHCT